jgi:hypothetical protein
MRSIPESISLQAADSFHSARLVSNVAHPIPANTARNGIAGERNRALTLTYPPENSAGATLLRARVSSWMVRQCSANRLDMRSR